MCLPASVNYLSSSSIVVKIHQGPRVGHPAFSGVDEFLRESRAVVDERRAPLPAVFTFCIVHISLFNGITSTPREITGMAGLCNGIHNASRTDCVDKSRFTATN